MFWFVQVPGTGTRTFTCPSALKTAAEGEGITISGNVVTSGDVNFILEGWTVVTF